MSRWKNAVTLGLLGWLFTLMDRSNVADFLQAQETKASSAKKQRLQK